MIDRIAFAIATALVALSLSAAFYLAHADDYVPRTFQECNLAIRWGHDPHMDCDKLPFSYTLSYQAKVDSKVQEVYGFSEASCAQERSRLIGQGAFMAWCSITDTE